jgi:hypothetical protein
MSPRAFAVRLLAALVVALALLPAAQGGGKGLSTKGQVKIGSHSHKMEGGKLYQVRVEGSGFRPLVNIRPGYLTHTSVSDDGDTLQGYFIPRETKAHRLFITPDLYDDLGDGPLDYTLTIKPIPLAEKPVLQEKGQLAATDPVYKNADFGVKTDCHFKAYPIKLKARQFYIIDLVKTDDLDPYLFLEGPDMKILAQDDDSGGNLNARILFQPRRDGEYRIIATSLSRATGGFTLTVRTQAKE